MSNRCLGIICGSITGYDSLHFGETIGYAPPWTLLDAQVYLGLMGWGMGLSVEGVSDDGMVEVPRDVFACSVGLVKGSNGEACRIVRAGFEVETPLIHAVLYRDGKWFDPQGDESLKEIECPAEVYQLWPVYRVEIAKEGG